ncbi:hypothetical protein KY284_026447 [Solanum tuberosum]|nr:hypothetical protein KY284_026447 [Solanum tuberosum]
MDGPVTGDKNSDEQAVEKVKSDDGATQVNCSLDEEVHLTNISTNLVQEHSHNEIQASFINSTTNPQNEFEELNCRTEAEQQGTYSQYHAGPNGQTQDHNAMKEQKIEMELKQVATRTYQDQNDQHYNTGSANMEVIDVESSSHFSFGVKPMDTIPSNGG